MSSTENPRLPKFGTMKSVILFLLLEGRSFENRDMWSYLNTGSSAARISELRSDGWEIDDYLSHPSCSDKTYFMHSSYIDQQCARYDVRSFLFKMSKLYNSKEAA